MGMNGHTRRLTALEEITERLRYEPHRRLAEARGVDPERVVDECKRLRVQRDQLRAQGLTDRQIIEARAADMGITPGELLRRAELLQRQADELLERS